MPSYGLREKTSTIGGAVEIWIHCTKHGGVQQSGLVVAEMMSRAKNPAEFDGRSVPPMLNAYVRLLPPKL